MKVEYIAYVNHKVFVRKDRVVLIPSVGMQVLVDSLILTIKDLTYHLESGIISVVVRAQHLPLLKVDEWRPRRSEKEMDEANKRCEEKQKEINERHWQNEQNLENLFKLNGFKPVEENLRRIMP